ncbi:MAG TPA: peptide chain release factor 1 [Rhabdochlamydiaceae bacterium]|nr:peptide chain release factor 1 [Rhabdochlamydiaceae bacterium]
MEDRIEERLRKLLERFNEVEELLGKSEILADKAQYRALAQEHARLSEVKEVWQSVHSLKKQLEENRLLTKEESDPSFLEMVQQEIITLERDLQVKKKQLESLLIPPDPRDNRNVILELRAGTGGDEAAIFVGDCARMYKYYAESKGWKYELLSCTPSELGGFKEHIMVISGKGVHRLMQYEAGGHRVQRVPDTETQGRVHTSAITVAVLMEPDEKEQLTLDERDLKIDTYRSSGAGGQHVNTTDSAVRITHIPTGTVVYCQEERSQHKNKDKALRLLTAKIVEEQRKKDEREMAELRATQVGSGDRSERIRTYNFSQNRVTDHRIDLTLYKLDKVMEGDLEEITAALVAHFYELKFAK